MEVTTGHFGEKQDGARGKGALVGVALTLALCLPGLSGCSSLSSALGMSKTPPDEFAVVTKAPLVLPPDYTLRPPQPGAQRPQELRPSEAAQAAVFSAPGSRSSVSYSPSEETLLAATGGDHADPAIRKVITEETTALLQKDRSFADNILFWRGSDNAEALGTPVNASAEAQRIRETMAKGETLDGADAPTISKSGGIF